MGLGASVLIGEEEFPLSAGLADGQSGYAEVA